VKPEITVVIPTHNRCDLLRQTLRAVLLQRDVDLEVIVVDDGSTDDTHEVVGRLTDPRLRLIRHERAMGVSNARNHGASEAAGAWVAFCDDDDLWAPEKLASQLAAAADTGRKWVYGGAVVIDNTLKVRSGAPPLAPEQLLERLAGFNPLPGGSSNVIMRADLLREVGCWDPHLVNLADWDLWIRLARCGLPACVSAPLVGYRIHASNASANRALMLKEARLVESRYGHRIDYAELHHYLAWVSLRSSRRVPALGEFALAALHGQMRAVGRSVGILVDARLRRLTGRQLVYYHPVGWEQRANDWLAALRDTPDSS
jgi:glycosyltransferase involved in cell wall biosynthesis